MYGAYVIASEYINDFAESNSNKMILLMSDGDINGCRNLDESLEVINRNRTRSKLRLLHLWWIQIVQLYSDLKTIAEYSNGELHYVQNTSSLKSSFSATSQLVWNKHYFNQKRYLYFESTRSLKAGFSCYC